jgi:ABC-type lipoprotein release transport system permease subunit
MWSIIKLSWKNIWRNPMRSSVVVVAVVLGTWAGIFMSAFMNGMSQQYIRDHLANYTGHIQVHDARYAEDNLPEFYIRDADSLVSHLRKRPFVEEVASRSVVNGLASSATNNFGVTIQGVWPKQEQQVSSLHEYIQDGEYLDTSLRNPVVIGAPLARRLSIETGSRMVLNFQDVDGNITAGAFRVSGIYKSANSGFDESNVFVLAEDLNDILGRENATHEIVMLVDDFKQAKPYTSRLEATFQSEGLTIQNWGEVAPTLRYMDANMDFTLYIIMTIIIIALMFGIINTMLMAVMERTQEIGMLMAIGINKKRTFAMIFWETLFLTMIGVPLGMGLSRLSIAISSNIGIDLGMFAEGLSEYGLSSVIYPELEALYYLNIALLMIVATLFSSLYPAWKALQLNPVQAIRKI